MSKQQGKESEDRARELPVQLDNTSTQIYDLNSKFSEQQSKTDHINVLGFELPAGGELSALDPEFRQSLGIDTNNTKAKFEDGQPIGDDYEIEINPSVS